MDESETLEVSTEYLKLLKEHIDSTYDHLQGFNPSVGIPHASYFPCRSFWTSEEKDIFFHALSVHSRLRPDLIAAELPNKTVVDVCLFLELLGKASKEESRLDSRGLRAFPPALEISGKWISWEEEQAYRISINQPFWEDRRRHQERIRTARALCPSLETSKRRKVNGESLNEDEKPYHDRIRAYWKKQDTLKDLSSSHLRAIDHILREAEEPGRFLDGENVLHRIKTEDVGGLQGSEPVIDPLLLHTGHRQQDAEPPKPVENGSMEDGSAFSASGLNDDGVLVSLESLSPRSRRRYQKRLYMRKKRAVLNGATNPSTTVSRLKPGRKSKHHLTAVSNISTSAPHADLRASGVQETTETAVLHEAVEDVWETDILPGAEPTGGWRGTTAQDKIVHDLRELGINALTLTEDGLGLFHLTNVGKLMEIYASIQGPSSSPSVGSCISASAIQILAAVVSQFVTEVVGRAITIREQEQMSKGHTKVWRMQSGLIPASTVLEAIELMGAQKDMKRHFIALHERASGCLTRPSTLTHAEAEAEAGGDQEQGVSREDEGNKGKRILEGQNFHLQSGYRELSGPVVRLPPFTSIPNQFSPRFKVGEGDACLEMDGDLMTDDTDEECIQRELDEDEDIDKADEILAQDSERELWLSVQAEQPEASRNSNRESDRLATQLDAGKPEEDAGYKGEGWKLRFSNPSQKSGVKSAVYVEDSD